MPTKKVKDSDRRRCPQACGNCQRRKQRCNGERPCRRCKSRNVDRECFFPNSHLMELEDLSSSQSLQQGDAARSPVRAISMAHRSENQQHSSTQMPEASKLPQSLCASHSALVPRLPRLLKDARGTLMFFGDSSNLSFLQGIRRVVRSSNGSCMFVDDSLLSEIGEDCGNQHAHWLHATTCPGKPSLAKATSLVRHYTWATSCVLDLFDESVLLQYLQHWIEASDHEEVTFSAIYYLVLAIGTQSSPGGDEVTERRYFNYGRYLTAYYFGQGPSITTTQCHILITWYLLCDAQRNAAYMHLGTAIRAAYALGLHRGDIAPPFESDQCTTRERLWKVIRVIDGFMSVTLGRPPSVQIDRREAKINGRYSACLDLCDIFESILNQVYEKRMVSAKVVEEISVQHRRWSSHFHDGLQIDCINSGDYLESNGVALPNVGLYHLREAFYWTIILLTLPFLMDFISKRADIKQRTQSSPDSLVVHTCVSAAISTIEMLQTLFSSERLPKKLPFVVNSIFISALTIGVSFFGDLDYYFPLQGHLCTAKTLLLRLGAHDPIAMRELAIVEKLQAACDAYLDKRTCQRMEQRALQLGSLFGDVQCDRTVPLIEREAVAESNQAENESLFCSFNTGFLEIIGNGQNSAETSKCNKGFVPYPSLTLPGQESFERSEEQNAEAFDTGFQPLDNVGSIHSPSTLDFNSFEDAFSLT